MLFLPWIGSLAPWLALPWGWGALLQRPWALVTYMFTHQSFWHLLWNMVMLVWAGRSLSDLLGTRIIYPMYLAGGLVGAVFFEVGMGLMPWISGGSNLAVPGLIGASASAMAFFWALVLLTPDQTLLLFGILPLRLRWLALGLALYDVIGLTGANAGGHWAHIGGALAGILGLRYLQGRWGFAYWGKARSRPVATVRPRSNDIQAETDRLLDKISRSGYASLKANEKEWLDRQHRG
ncbi:MAG: rhomboid family intramembrane serine protease [Bacteroidia bacterium]